MRKSQLVYLFAQVSLAIFNWLILTILARKFGKSLVGEYSIILAWLTPLFLLYSLQIKNRYLTSSDAFITQFTTIRVLLIVPLILFSSLLLLLGYQNEIIVGVFTIKLAELIFELPFMKDQKHNQLLKASTIQLVKNIIIYSLILFLTISTGSFQLAIMVGGGVSLIISLMYVLHAKLKIQFRLDRNLLKSLFPLGMAAFITSFTVSIPRLYLKEIVGLESVALYAVIFSFYAIWQLVFNNYFTGVLNNLSKIKVDKLVKLPLVIFSICSIVFYLFDENIYRFLFGESFIDASDYTVLLLLNIFISFWTSFFYYQLLSKNDYKSHLKINLILVSISLLIVPVGIYYLKVSGALIGQSLVQLVQIYLYRRSLLS